MSAVERNVAGSTMIVEMPMSAVWSRASSATAADSEQNAAASSSDAPMARAMPPTPPAYCAPASAPIPITQMPWTTQMSSCCTSWPATSDDRDTGEVSIRSMTPLLMSSMNPVPAQAPEYRTVIMRMPGTRNVM